MYLHLLVPTVDIEHDNIYREVVLLVVKIIVTSVSYSVSVK